jgi:hypothetical protein
VKSRPGHVRRCELARHAPGPRSSGPTESAGPDHVAEGDQSPCPAPQFGSFTEALNGPTETRKEVRDSGHTSRQVNNWCRARAAVPPWAAALAVLLQDASPAAIQILLEEIQFNWHATLGVPPNADAGTIRRACASLTRAVLRNRWSASVTPMNGPAGSDHVAERAQPASPASSASAPSLKR